MSDHTDMDEFLEAQQAGTGGDELGRWIEWVRKACEKIERHVEDVERTIGLVSEDLNQICAEHRGLLKFLQGLQQKPPCELCRTRKEFVERCLRLQREPIESAIWVHPTLTAEVRIAPNGHQIVAYVSKPPGLK